MSLHLLVHARSGALRRAALFALLGLLAVAASCHDPQSPAPTPPAGDDDWAGAFDPGTATLRFRIEGSNGEESTLRLVAGDIAFDSTNQHLSVQVAILNAGTDTLPGPAGVLVGQFDPDTVRPVNAEPLACPDCIGPPCPCPFSWVFDHHGTYGEDDLLGPGETSTPVEWILLDPAGESFSFRARVEPGTQQLSGTIAGSVFVDANANGSREVGERGIPSAQVNLHHGANAVVAQTDADGRYAFELAEPGLYEVTWDPRDGCQPTTPIRLQIVIVRRSDGSLSGYGHADFGCRGTAPPDSGIVVIGVVFDDLNRNGIRERNEPGVVGVGITGSSSCEFAPVQTSTDSGGVYRLLMPPCVPPYVVGHGQVPGYVDTSPNPIVLGGVLPGDPGSGEPPSDPAIPANGVLRADFGIALVSAPSDSASVEGFVFRDSNRNGVKEAGEPGIPGVRVTSSSLVCMIPVVGQTITDDRGHYLLKQQDVHCPTPWMVGHEPVAGACDTGPNPVIVGLPDGVSPDPWPSNRYRVDFGVASCDTVPPGGLGIAGVVFIDGNGSGSRDPGEAGVPGALVSLESVCDIWRAVRTDERGGYVFRPEIVGGCPVTAVRLVEPQFPAYTTPNPFPLDESWTPPGSVFEVDFGVRLAEPAR